MAARERSRLFRWRDKILSRSGPRHPTTRFVLLALAKHMDAQGGSCFPSQETLADETGLSERSVGVHVAMAQQTGWLLVSLRKRGKNWRQYQYHASFPAEHSSAPNGAPEDSSGPTTVAAEVRAIAGELRAVAAEDGDNLLPNELRGRASSEDVYEGGKEGASASAASRPARQGRNETEQHEGAIDFEREGAWKLYRDRMVEQNGLTGAEAEALILESIRREGREKVSRRAMQVQLEHEHKAANE